MGEQEKGEVQCRTHIYKGLKDTGEAKLSIFYFRLSPPYIDVPQMLNYVGSEKQKESVGPLIWNAHLAGRV